jgi:SOS response regulatory protein OraA/RecX
MLKKVGPRKIEYELQAAGVDRETAACAVRANNDEERERHDIRALHAKRKRMLVSRHGEAYLDTPVGRNNLIGYLLKQGYDAALVRSVVKETPVVDD